MREGVNGPGGSLGSKVGIRRGGRGGRDRGRIGGISGKINHGTHWHIIIVKGQSLVSR